MGTPLLDELGVELVTEIWRQVPLLRTSKATAGSSTSLRTVRNDTVLSMTKLAYPLGVFAEDADILNGFYAC